MVVGTCNRLGHYGHVLQQTSARSVHSDPTHPDVSSLCPGDHTTTIGGKGAAQHPLTASVRTPGGAPGRLACQREVWGTLDGRGGWGDDGRRRAQAPLGLEFACTGLPYLGEEGGREGGRERGREGGRGGGGRERGGGGREGGTVKPKWCLTTTGLHI